MAQQTNGKKEEKSIQTVAIPHTFAVNTPYRKETMREIARENFKQLLSEFSKGSMVKDIAKMYLDEDIDWENDFVWQVNRNTFLTGRGDLPSANDLVLLFVFLNYLKVFHPKAIDQYRITFSWKHFLTVYQLQERWKKDRAIKLYRRLKKWQRIGVFILSPETHSFYSGSIILEMFYQDVLDKRGRVSDMEVEVLLGKSATSILENPQLHLLPIFLAELSSVLASVGIFYFVNVYPYGDTYSKLLDIKEFTGSKTIQSNLAYVLSAWNTEAVGRKYVPIGAEKEYDIPPLLFTLTENKVIHFYIADERWLYGGRPSNKYTGHSLPRVFNLPSFQKRGSKKSGYSYSPAFGLIQALASQSEVLARMFLLMIDFYYATRGQDKAAEVLRIFIESQSHRHRGQNILARTIKNLSPEAQQLITDQNFIRMLVSHIERTDFLHTPRVSLLKELSGVLKEVLKEAGVNLHATQKKKETTSVPTSQEAIIEAQKQALKQVWDNTPAIQEIYLRRVIPDYDNASEERKRLMSRYAFKLFLQENLKVEGI